MMEHDGAAGKGVMVDRCILEVKDYLNRWLGYIAKKK
jgi:hypothetical protein